MSHPRDRRERFLIGKRLGEKRGFRYWNGFKFIKDEGTYTILLPKLMEERLAGDATLLPVVGALAFAVDALRRAHAIHRRPAHRPHDVEAHLHAAGGDPRARARAARLRARLDGAAARGIVAAVVFGQVTINETMTARYISPGMRAKIYSLRFFIGFLGGAAAAPIVGYLHERTGQPDAGRAVPRRHGRRHACLRARVPGPARGAGAGAVGAGEEARRRAHVPAE